MIPLLRASEMQTFEQYSIQTLGIPDAILMEHAALAVAKALRSRFGSALARTSGVILAGPGNNGGDALATARILRLNYGVQSLRVVTPFNSKSPLCKAQTEYCKRLGLFFSETVPRDDCDWIIDGLFGIGFKRSQGKAVDVLNAVNAKRAWKLAIDLPSGLLTDTGRIVDVAFAADRTVTLGHWKRGLVTGQAASVVGRVSCAPILVPREIPVCIPAVYLWERSDCVIPARSATSHKGNFGHVTVVAGPEEQLGASTLCAHAALRSGAGLATVITNDVKAARGWIAPEIQLKREFADLLADPKRVWVIGPGLGSSTSAWETVQTLLRSEQRVVLDADALNLLASGGAAATELVARRKASTFLTPHPLEAARLLDTRVDDVESDRYASASKLAAKFRCPVLLKGKGSIAACRGEPSYVVNRGDVSLAKGGSGDALTGIIAALAAQGVLGTSLLATASYMHGVAAERLTARRGEARSLLTSELCDELPRVFGGESRTGPGNR